MEDLTGSSRYPAYLVPSSMQAGNTTADDPQLAMTAPGSIGVLPVPEKPDVLPMPRWTNDTPIPVSDAPNKPDPTGPGVGTGPPWRRTVVAPLPGQSIHNTSGPWKEL